VLAALPEGLQCLEVVLAVALDTRMRPISTVLIGQGGASSAAFVPRDIFRPLLRLGARCFVLVHNHPSGTPTPSEEDIALKNTLAQFGRELDLPLLDHVIVGSDGVCSFADLSLLPTEDELSRPEEHHGVA
jgi:DNA repair protein RadC